MAITKKKNGKYQVRVYVGYDHITGKRKTKYATCETMREARLKEAQLITDVETGELVPEWDKPKEQRHLTFDEAYEEWFDIYKRQGRTEATVQKTQRYFTGYLLKPEVFGGLYLERMTRKDIQQRVNNFVPKYVTSKTMIGYAKQVLKWAVDNEEIEFNDNPLEHIQVVKQKTSKKRKIRYYDERQIKLFEDGIKEYTQETGREDYFTILMLLIRTGARFGEVIALRWHDIDFENKIITFDARISYLTTGKCEYIDGLKNGDEARRIEIDNSTIRVLRVWKNSQRKRHLFFGYSFDDDKLLFSNEIATKTYKDIYYKASVLGTYLQAFNKWYNSSHSEQLPYLNLHGFRHTHASLLLSNGVWI